jgi:ABC-2 type transport system ATP-binding protein
MRPSVFALEAPRPLSTDIARPRWDSPLVSVSHLTKTYGPHVAVRDVSFGLTPGVTGLLGPNGAGKSTLVRCLAGLCGWDEGEIRIAGIDPGRRARAARGRVGFMPERVSFPPEMTVESYVNFVAEGKKIARSERRSAVEGALRRTGLTNTRSRIIANLSKGYRQRVGLAQALVGEPPILILDEPSAGLDPLNTIEIRDVLRSYAQTRVVFVSTHILGETRLLCDRVLVMSEGRLVYDGPTTGMTTTVASNFRLRVRSTVRGGEPPAAEVPGTTMVSCVSMDGHYDLVVRAESDITVGKLIARLSAAGWLVVGAERAADSLEDAFRAAVLGDRGGCGP